MNSPLRTLLLILVVISVLPTSDAFFRFMSDGAAPRNTEDDLYGILGVPRSATVQEIKKAFRHIAKTEHPDLKATAEEKERATERMRQVLRAYNVLSDENKRAEFDRYGTIAGERNSPTGPGGSRGPGGQGGPPPTFPPEFEEFMRFFGGDFARAPPPPIPSKTPDLTLRTYRNVILPYRGSRMTLIQFYAEMYSSCRNVGKAWEQLATSPLVTSHGVRLFRVNVHTEEGAQVADVVLGEGGSHRAVPNIIAITDGTQWEMKGLSQYLYHDQMPALYSALVTFVSSFYSSFEYTLTDGAQTAEDILQWLDRADGTPVRVLLAGLPDSSSYVGIAAAVDDPKVTLRVVADKVELIKFVSTLCDRSLGVPHSKISEIVVVFNDTVNPHSIAKGTKGVKYPAWCNRLHIIPSRTEMALHRIVKYIRASYISDQQLIQAKYPRSLPILRAPSDIQDCKYCAFWVIPECDATKKITDIADPPIWANPRRFEPFTLMVVCLDRQPRMAFSLQSVVAAAQRNRPPKARVTLQKPVLLFYAGARPTSVGLYSHEDIARGGGLTGLEAALAEFLEAPPTLQVSGTAMLEIEGGLDALLLKEPESFVASDVAELLGRSGGAAAAPHFPLPLWKFVIWKAQELYESIPFNSFGILVVVWMLSKRLFPVLPQERRNPPPAAAPPVPQPTSSFALQPFTQADLGDAHGAPFVLIALVSVQTATADAYKEVLASRIMEGSVRFAVRQIISSDANHAAFVSWARSHGGDTTAPYAFIVIRVRRRLAAIKPTGRSLRVWCSELADGTVAPALPLPL